MKEIISLSSKAKANRYGKSPSFSTEALAPFPGSLSEMPLRSIPAITWLIKLSNNRPRECLGFQTPAEVSKAKCCTCQLNAAFYFLI